MNSSMEIAKSGWMHRRSSVLYRWKRNWFVLYKDGLLRYFASQDSPRAEEVIVPRSACRRIKCDVSDSPPEGLPRQAMFELEMYDGSSLVLCAESSDDMNAWKCALDEARLMDPPNSSIAPCYSHHVPVNISYEYDPNRYSGGNYPGHVFNQGSTQVIHSPNGSSTTIINSAPGNNVMYVDDRRYRRYGRRRYGCGYGAGTGFLAGAMLGSALMWPYCW